MQAFLQDLRYAIRTLRRSPASTLVIVASLAIGIGANTAIFTVVNALLLKPCRIQTRTVWRSSGCAPQESTFHRIGPRPPASTCRRRTGSFEEMSISHGRSGTLLGFDQPERVEALRTSSSLFHLLGAGRSTAGCSARGGYAGQAAGRDSESRLLEARVQLRSERHRSRITMNGVVEGSGESRTSSRSPACSVRIFC